MLEEGADESGINLLQRQRRWFDLKAVGGEHEQQLEARGIGIARVPAGAPLASEGVAQERLDEGGTASMQRPRFAILGVPLSIESIFLPFPRSDGPFAGLS